MKLSTFAIIMTILTFGYGIAFVFLPDKLMSLYGLSLGTGGVIVARYLGGTNFFLGMIFWSYSKVAPSAKSWPKLLLFALIYDIIQLILTIMALQSGQANSLGWSTVGMFAILAFGSGYFLVQCKKLQTA